VFATYQDKSEIPTSVVDLNFTLYTGHVDGSIRRWRKAGGYLDDSFDNMMGKTVVSLVESADGFYVAQSGGIIKRFLADTGILNISLVTDPGITGMSKLASGSFVIAVNTSLWYTSKSFEVQAKLSIGVPLVSLVANEDSVFTVDNKGTIYKCKIDSVTEQSTKLISLNAPITALALADDFLFASSTDRSIRKVSIISGQVVAEFKKQGSSPGHLGSVNDVKICSGYLFSVSGDLTLRKWDPVSGELLETNFGHLRFVTRIYCKADRLYTTSEDRSVIMWKIDTPNVVTKPLLSGNNPPSRPPIMVDSTNSNSNAPILLIVGVVFAALLLIALLAMFRKLKKKNRAWFRTPTGSEATETASVTAFTENTLVGTKMKLSIPGFLEISPTDFRRRQPIAKGGGGTIYVAEVLTKKTKIYGDLVVLKVVADRYTNLTEKMQASFDQEIAVMNLLKDKDHIAKIIGFCREPCCFLMKLYESSLYDFLHKNKDKKSKIVLMKILKGLSSAIFVCHQNMIAHCDLKPQNVLMENGECYLTDFGICRVLSDDILASKMFNVSVVKGVSIMYAGPEALTNFRDKQSNIVKVLEKSDIYSWAIILYEVITSREPWSRQREIRGSSQGSLEFESQSSQSNSKVSKTKGGTEVTKSSAGRQLTK
jgi:tRNA A-37 threonylcarbamoyl transferase component Bud32